MCQFASSVLTEQNEYWSDKTDSHTAIMAEHGLREDLAGVPQVLKIELIPAGRSLDDLNDYEYHIDQDVMPRWFDAARDEARARAALRRRFPKGVQTISVHASFVGSKLTSLGKLQTIGVDAYFWGSQITSLGSLQTIGGEA